MDAFWDDDAPPTADRVIASLVSRVRRAIGSDVITGSVSTGYRFNAAGPGRVTSPNWRS